MGCFSFGPPKRKNPDHRTPDTSFTYNKPKPRSPPFSLPPSVPPTAYLVPQPPNSPTRDSRSPRQTSPANSTSPHDKLFEGRPMPLPAPLRSSASATSGNLSFVKPPRAFKYAEVKAMTRDFAREGYLGEGGFGEVYKGWILEDGKKVPVAVKRLNTGGFQGESEWVAEVSFLGRLHHTNLVTLIGYCSEGESHRLLVYEFCANRSLEHALFQRYPGDPVLPWNRRITIALGAAKGIAFLHEEAESQVIYRDFKTSNVLLDSDWSARLSDFGLARSGPEGDKSHVTTRVVGTIGYAAPEYVMTGHLTAKSDVWGFGVVMLEILTGRVAMDKSRPREEANLVEWAAPYLETPSKLYRIMDPHLCGRYSVKGAQLCAQLILQCLQRNAKQRPRMSAVVAHLTPIQDMHDMAGFTADSVRAPVWKVHAAGGGKRVQVAHPPS